MKTLCIGLLIFCTSCGYSLRGSTNALLLEKGIEKIYIEPVTNQTFKPGVENIVFKALVKIVSSHRQLRLVQNKVDADAILTGVVTGAQFYATASTTGDKLQPTALASSFASYSVATVYQADLSCNFILSASDRQLWSSGFGRSKTFPGSNQLGPFGTTSALINESEFERALSDLSDSMVVDVHESMLGVF